MAKKTSIINVVVAGDSKGMRRSLGKATKSLGDFSKKVGAISLGVGTAMIGMGAKTIGLAVDFEESLSKAQQIFGTSAKAIEDSAKGAATAVGLSKAEFLEASSTFGIFGKASGLAGDDLSSFSIDLVGMAADVASFNNLKPEAAVEKLAAGLRGSMEPLQSVGILMNAAMVEAEALDMGLIDVGDTLTEGQKIMARHSLIMQQLGETGTMGDFARTSDGLANKQRILTARMKNLGIEMGMVLLPIAEKLAEWLEKLIGKFEDWSPALQTAKDAVNGFIGRVKELALRWAPIIKAKVTELADIVIPALVTAFEVVRNFMRDKLIPKFKEIVGYLKMRLPEASRAFIDHINRNKTKYTMLAGAITGLAVAFGLLVAKAKVGAVVTALFGMAGGVAALNLALAVGIGFFAFVGAMAALYITSEKFRDFVDPIFEFIVEDAKRAMEWIEKILDGLDRIVEFNLSDVLPGGEGFWGDAPWQTQRNEEIDELLRRESNGGIDKQSFGPQPAGGNITINMPSGSDGQDVVSALQNYVRANGSVALSTTGLTQV